MSHQKFHHAPRLGNTVLEYHKYLSSVYLTAKYLYRAAEHCSRQKRKTINGEDIIMSLHSLGFDNYIEPMQKYLIQHRENKAMFSQTQGNACKDDSSDSSMQISKPGELPLSLIPGHWD
ncbi:hypothetical protein A3Q56_06189 [Intoshia linei]|uniref:Transcription factor CBF/NF-Y/archaeal histone domain-containing protein n=1 Tax=Intoshia linei TaxID=1819745 RepID=A0A177AVS1_9BILA|nr:hypothetical protein A3Q56_06189 [Intoshia linei]